MTKFSGNCGLITFIDEILNETFILCAVSIDNIRKLIKKLDSHTSHMAHGHRMLRMYMIKIYDTEIFISLKIIAVCL